MQDSPEFSHPEIDLSQMDIASEDLSDVSPLDIPVIILFVVLILIVATQFFTRYVLNDSLGWTEEMARYLLIVLGFVGSVTCVRKGSHIYLEFFYRYVPRGAIKPMAVTVEMITGFFFGYLGYLGLAMVERTAGQKMITVPWPKAIIWYVVMAACVAMVLYTIRNIVRLIHTDAEDVAHNKLENF
ncbi:TRAP transporter small permease [Tropicimonas aquimaris]|uniref:TRAP transporter small permease protein n=1 Tax=Tropicimonas aquimaris TaxID=914152 RepID=A0ABW3IR90_9RHOB